MSDARSDRRLNTGEIRERLTRLETTLVAVAGEVAPLRMRSHELATNVTVLLDFSTRAEQAHADMATEIRGLGVEMRLAMSQHDRRDDDRFGAASARLASVEGQLGILDAEAQTETRQSGQRQNRNTALIVALIGAVVMLAGVTLSKLLGH